MIVKEKDGYHVKSEKGKNLGGPYKSRKQAEARLAEVEKFKHMNKGDISNFVIMEKAQVAGYWRTRRGRAERVKGYTMSPARQAQLAEVKAAISQGRAFLDTAFGKYKVVGYNDENGWAYAHPVDFEPKPGVQSSYEIASTRRSFMVTLDDIKIEPQSERLVDAEITPEVEAMVRGWLRSHSTLSPEQKELTDKVWKYWENKGSHNTVRESAGKYTIRKINDHINRQPVYPSKSKTEAKEDAFADKLDEASSYLDKEQKGKNSEKEEDRLHVAKKLGVKPENLKYVGVQHIMEGKYLHMWNVEEPGHPKHMSTVTGLERQGSESVHESAGEYEGGFQTAINKAKKDFLKGRITRDQTKQVLVALGYKRGIGAAGLHEWAEGKLLMWGEDKLAIEKQKLVNRKDRLWGSNIGSIDYEDPQAWKTLGYLASHGRITAEVPTKHEDMFREAYEELTGEALEPGNGYTVTDFPSQPWGKTLRIMVKRPDFELNFGKLLPAYDIRQKGEYISIGSGDLIKKLLELGFKMGSNHNIAKIKDSVRSHGPINDFSYQFDEGAGMAKSFKLIILEKSRPHKYLRRMGVSGQYEYVYHEPEIGFGGVTPADYFPVFKRLGFTNIGAGPVTSEWLNPKTGAKVRVTRKGNFLITKKDGTHKAGVNQIQLAKLLEEPIVDQLEISRDDKIVRDKPKGERPAADQIGGTLEDLKVKEPEGEYEVRTPEQTKKLIAMVSKRIEQQEGLLHNSKFMNQMSKQGQKMFRQGGAGELRRNKKYLTRLKKELKE